MSNVYLSLSGLWTYTTSWDTTRPWRDAKLYEIDASTSEVQHMLIERKLFTKTC